MQCLPPPHLGRLTGLRRLSVSGNQLTCLPEEVGRLTSLQALNVDANQLQELTPSLGGFFAMLRPT